METTELALTFISNFLFCSHFPCIPFPVSLSPFHVSPRLSLCAPYPAPRETHLMWTLPWAGGEEIGLHFKFIVLKSLTLK